MQKISAMATLYNSAAHIPQFVERMSRALNETGHPYEIVLVNDGCPSDSLAVAIALTKSTPALRVVDLSYNFGHHRAMMIGLDQVGGSWVYLTDVDLEEPPEFFLECWKQRAKTPTGDVFYGLDNTKKGTLVSRFFSRCFYRSFNWLSGLKINENILQSRLMSRRYVDTLRQFRERNLFFPGIWEIAGYQQTPVSGKKTLLPHRSNYTLRRKLIMAMDAITSFSEKPLMIVFVFGAVQTAISFSIFIIVIVLRVIGYLGVPGWASVIAIVSALSGSILFSIGLLGLYLARVFIEVKQRPYGIVRGVYHGGVDVHRK